jgi:aminopeptidase-like protein
MVRNNPEMIRAQELEHYFDRLWPICRSITGNGLRASLDIISELIPLQKTEVPSGTAVFDWTIPKEWNIRDAWIKTPDGRVICRLSDHNLHVVNYSVPVDRKMTLAELRPHLHVVKSMPDAIPYITSYYREKWGFCLSAHELATLPEEGEYHVMIDSALENGSLTYGECVIPGSGSGEVLISTYLCHPSMANNELSGPLAAAFVAREMMQMAAPKHTYRFLFIPETIGAIAYLANHGMRLKDTLVAGYVLTCCGDRGDLTYKLSRRGDSEADHIALHVLRHGGFAHRTTPFAVGGSDERQYCSPGFNLPVGSIIRTPYQKYKEYHTSLDNKSFLSFPHLSETVDAVSKILRALELNANYKSTVPYCEPQLGRRGMYPDSVNPEDAREKTHRLMHFLAYADGASSLREVSELRNESIFLYQDIVDQCIRAGLIEG